jgi:hypothetical protein
MAWTTPSTVVAGQTLSAAFWNEQVRDNLNELSEPFATASTWSPVVDQNGTVSSTTDHASYIKIGRLVMAWCYVTVTGTGSANNVASVTLPVAATTDYAGFQTIGNAIVRDSNTSTSYHSAATLRTSGATTIAFAGDWSNIGFYGQYPNITLGANDWFRFSVTYLTD